MNDTITREQVIAKLQEAVDLWASNKRQAEDAINTARHFGAPTAPFEAQLTDAKQHYADCRAMLTRLTGEV